MTLPCSVSNCIPQLFKGDLGEARKTLDRFKLLQPELEVHASLYEKTLAYLEANPVTPGDLRKFEGEYRGGNSEQTSTFWVHKNTLLQYISNQGITPLIMGGGADVGYRSSRYRTNREKGVFRR